MQSRCVSWNSIFRVIAISLIGSLFLPIVHGQEGDTLQSLLQKASAAFQSGQYESAAMLFDSIEEQFVEEEEYRAVALQKILLPMRAYSLLRVDRAGEAAAFFELFLENYPLEAEKRNFVRFHLAQAYEQTDDADKAIVAYQQFEAENKGRPEASLAALRRADLLRFTGRVDESIQLYNEIYAGGTPLGVRRQARLRALQATIAAGHLDLSRDILLNTPWRVETMPELAQLAFSAHGVGDQLLAESRYAEATRCYRLVPPKNVLIKKQIERLRDTRAALRNSTRLTAEPGKALWREYYTNLAQKLEEDLQSLQDSPDYTSGFFLRYGQSLLLGDRGEEAWLVFQTLAENPEVENSLRVEAHYRWILAARALSLWNETLEIAQSFQRRHPESPLVTQVIFLVAEAYKELRDYERAATLLGTLIDQYPKHPQLPRWVFTRGFYYTLISRYPSAREDFQQCLESGPPDRLGEEARLWHALSWFFEKNYPIAVDELVALGKSLKHSPLQPDVVYWLASTLYSQKEFDSALEHLDLYFKKYPGHRRVAEASVLRGDILMGQGELLGAAVAFSKVTPEAGRLFPYATFQTGKIYRAMEEFERMASHFENYLTRTDLPANSRKSEALYWTGWAYEQLGRIESAFPVFTEALVSHGNDPAATDIQLILKSLHRLHNKRFPASEKPAESFSLWLSNEIKSTQTDGKITYHSRLNLYLADLYEKENRFEEANALMMETIRNAPLDSLGAEFLGWAGLLLGDLEFPSAKDYFEALVERFPERPERGMGYYGLAKQRFKNKRPEQALPWLEKLADELPAHPLAADATLLQGKVLAELGKPHEAIARFEALLKIKMARGRLHAEALLGIARSYRLLNEPEKAIGYYQRIFTVYRAYTVLVSESYLQSAELFEEINNLRAARDTLEEFLDNPGLGQPEQRSLARAEIARLESLLKMEQTEVTMEISQP